MIRSETFKGLIYSGNTQLASTIVVEQTGKMQLTVRKGVFTHTDGSYWTLPANAVFNLVADPTYPIEVKIEIGDIESDSVADIWCGTKVNDGIEEFDLPVGWNTGHTLVFNFVIPAGCTDLTDVDIFVLTVLPGFPEGTTAEDWKTQTGGMK